MIGVNRADGFSVAPGMKAIRFSSRLATLTVAGLIIGGTASMSASTHADVAVTHEDHADNGELTAEQQVEIYQATARFNDVDVAFAAGYAPAPIDECVDVEGYGGMGLRYVNLALAADGVIDPATPEVLAYVPTADGGLELGAVEYANIDADQDLATDDDRPELFGHKFDGPMDATNPAHAGAPMPVPVHYDLHVWLYRENPDGMLAAFNPDVSCRPDAPTADPSPERVTPI